MRNENILCLVLNGCTYKATAKEYNLSVPRIRQIVMKTTYNISKHINIPNTGKHLDYFSNVPIYSLETLRNMKDEIITALEKKEESLV